MPNPPVILTDRLTAVGGAAIMAFLVFAIGMAIHKAISVGCSRKRIQGRPVVWWTAILMFLGACYGAWIADNQQYYLREVVGGMGGFGLLAGLLVGNAHGFLNLYRARTSKSKASTTAKVSTIALHQPLPADEQADENPYKPPRGL